MSPFIAIVKRELRSILRERTILIAIVIQLFIASFSSALLIGLLSVYDPGTMTMDAKVPLRVGILGDSSSPLVGFLREREMKVIPFADASAAARAFQANELDLILAVPADNGSVMDMKMYLPRSEVLSSFIQILMHEPLKRYENWLRQERGIVVNFTNLTGKASTTFEFLYSVLLPLLMFFPAFVAGSLVIDSISEELETKTLDTLWSAPLSLNMILGAKIAAALLVSVAQCLLWLGLLRLNHVDIQNPALVLGLATVASAINISFSAFIVMVLRDRERSQFLYSLYTLTIGSLSYVFDWSPLELTTRLAVGDHYTGASVLALYAVLLCAVLLFLVRAQKRLFAGS